jgi:SAM-dependent methyltransferase
LKDKLRQFVKRERRRAATWVRALDRLRLIGSPDGRAVLLTSLLHSKEIQQTTTYTAEERYPALFDYAARIAPSPRRILSFGCSTGEEISSLRARFPQAEILGVEINKRCRRIAAQRLAQDSRIRIVATLPDEAECFDLILALAVLQREPYRVLETGTRNLAELYSFDRFDVAVSRLCALLKPAGILLVDNSHYRVEDSTSATRLEPLLESPAAKGPFFKPNGWRYEKTAALTAFRKAGIKKRGA